MELSDREKPIMCCLMCGASNADVAERLGVTLYAAKSYVKRLYRKLDVVNRTEAARWGWDHGQIIDADVRLNGADYRMT